MLFRLSGVVSKLGSLQLLLGVMGGWCAHSELYNSTSWETYESFMRWYQFHFKAIYQHQANYDENELLSDVSKVMDNGETCSFVARFNLSD